MNRFLRYTTFLGVISTLFIFSAGCLDVEDIDRRMMVSPIALDAGPDGRWVINLRMPLVRPDGSYGTDHNDGTSNMIYRKILTTGIFPAVIDAQSRDEHAIFLGHCRTVIFGEAFAKRGLTPALDFLNRLPRLPPSAYLVIARPNAEKLIRVKWPETEMHDQNLRLFFSNGENPIPSIKRWQMFKVINEPLLDPVVPLLEPSDNNTTVRQLGLAVFHRDRMVGTLNYEESILLGLIRNNHQFAKIVIPGPGISSSFQLINSRSSIRSRLTGDHPVFIVKLRLSTYLTELGAGYESPFTPDTLIKLEKRAEVYLRKRIRVLLVKLREMNSDPVQLGNYFRIQQGKCFSMKKWPEQYRQAEYRVNVEFDIERLGVLR